MVGRRGNREGSIYRRDAHVAFHEKWQVTAHLGEPPRMARPQLQPKCSPSGERYGLICTNPEASAPAEDRRSPAPE